MPIPNKRAPMMLSSSTISLLISLQILFVAVASTKPLEDIRVLVTAPPAYAQRLASALELRGAIVIDCPTVITEFLLDDKDGDSALHNAFVGDLSSYDYVAFTSRRGIEAAFRSGGNSFINRLNDSRQNPVAAIALGADANALLAGGVHSSAIMRPADASPNGIVSLLCNLVSDPKKRASTNILCPVPKLSNGLTEPEVVPNFLASLRIQGFVVHRVDAYETRWSGPSEYYFSVMKKLRKEVNVIAISSTAEVEGLLLLCAHYNIDLLSCKVKVAAHGPVTARGAALLGLNVDHISQNYSSFDGLCDAVSLCVQK